MIGSKKRGALQPRLIPLRVHEGGVHGPVQELLVEQDTVGELHCGSTQNRLLGPERAVSISVVHPSSVLVTVRAKKKKHENTAKKSLWLLVPEIRGLLLGTWSCVAVILGGKKKTPVGNHFGLHGTR